MDHTHTERDAIALNSLSRKETFKVFLYSNTYSKTLTIRIIYALFSQLVVGFCSPPQASTEAHSLDPTGGLTSAYP